MTDFQQYFANTGRINEARELLWERTIAQVAQLLSEAEKRIRSAELQKHYCGLDGWYRKSKSKLAKTILVRVPEETSVSEAVVEQIEKLQGELLLASGGSEGALDNALGLVFATEQPRSTKKGIGRKAKPTDIRVYRPGSETIDLRIEAKVLLADGDISKEYIGPRGLGRFSDPDEPYTDHEVGGMLAYTVTDSRNGWLKKINDGLGACTPPLPAFNHTVDGTSNILFSAVPFNKAGSPRTQVLVFHIVLEFDSDPAAR